MIHSTTPILISAVAVIISVSVVMSSVSASASASYNPPNFRPPAVPLVTFEPMQQKFTLHDVVNSVNTSYWEASPMSIFVILSYNNKRFQLVGALATTSSSSSKKFAGSSSNGGGGGGFGFGLQNAVQTGHPLITPTQTIITFTLPGEEETVKKVTLKFISPMLADDLDVLARPSTYVRATIETVKNKKKGSHSSFFRNLRGGGDDSTTTSKPKLFVAASAVNVVKLWPNPAELVQWNTETAMLSQSIRLGTVKQNVLNAGGDAFMLDWGYLYLSSDRAVTSQFAGGDAEIINTFIRTGQLPQTATVKPPQPNSFSGFGVGVAAVVDLLAQQQQQTSGSSSSGSVYDGYIVFSYNNISPLYYFGENLRPWWNRFTGTAQFQYEVVDNAVQQAKVLFNRCDAFDAKFFADTSSQFGDRYAAIAAVAYRQAFAALDWGRSTKFGEDWCLLKEISSGGDVQTMDVIFPSSPLYFYTNPTIIKMLLLPVLHYADNQTSQNFTDPYSPHQLSISWNTFHPSGFPIANAPAGSQEPMPLENTGNMFLMLRMYMKMTNSSDLFFAPYGHILAYWADYLMNTQLPNPPYQRCTDDFAGKLAENVNLAAKGDIALRAFADICASVRGAGNAKCELYKTKSREFAAYWVKNGIETDDIGPHSRIAFNWTNSWSSKYNFFWQRFLGFDNDPFQNYDELCENEVNYYLAKANKYGFPMDLRHTYQKLDWMTWSSALTHNRTKFKQLFGMIFKMANETSSRWPLTDLFLTTNADIWLMFRSRSVVGAVFGPMMVDKWVD